MQSCESPTPLSSLLFCLDLYYWQVGFETWWVFVVFLWRAWLQCLRWKDENSWRVTSGWKKQNKTTEKHHWEMLQFTLILQSYDANNHQLSRYNVLQPSNRYMGESTCWILSVKTVLWCYRGASVLDMNWSGRRDGYQTNDEIFALKRIEYQIEFQSSWVPKVRL